MCNNSDESLRKMDKKVSNEASSLHVDLSKSQQYGGMSGRHIMNDNSKGYSKTHPHQVLHETIKNFIQDSNFWSVASVLFIVGWSCVCAWGSIKLKAIAAVNPGGRAALWLEWISGTEAIVGVLGVLFTFSLVFRFQKCYDRWWEGRTIWGGIISSCLNLDQMGRNWFTDKEYSERYSRFIVLFAYACKAQLRGLTLKESDGVYLMRKGLLTQEELDDIEGHPCWQPHYALDMLRATMSHGHKAARDRANIMLLPYDHNAFGQPFFFFEGEITKLHDLIGEAIRVRSAGLPKSYDSLHHLLFYAYFILAPMAWASPMGWMLPFVISVVSLICLALINLGTDLVDPFGFDLVDLPLESYCRTIELQIVEAEKRSRVRSRFAEKSKANPRMSLDFITGTNRTHRHDKRSSNVFDDEEMQATHTIDFQ